MALLPACAQPAVFTWCSETALLPESAVVLFGQRAAHLRFAWQELHDALASIVVFPPALRVATAGRAVLHELTQVLHHVRGKGCLGGGEWGQGVEGPIEPIRLVRAMTLSV